MKHFNYGFEDSDDENDIDRKLSSYSDLFAAISFVILFLYVSSVMFNNISGVSKIHEIERIKKEYSTKLALKEREMRDRLSQYQIDNQTSLQIKDKANQTLKRLESLKDIARIEENKYQMKANELKTRRNNIESLKNQLLEMLKAREYLTNKLIQKDRALQDKNDVIQNQSTKITQIKEDSLQRIQKNKMELAAKLKKFVLKSKAEKERSILLMKQAYLQKKRVLENKMQKQIIEKNKKLKLQFKVKTLALKRVLKNKLMQNKKLTRKKFLLKMARFKRIREKQLERKLRLSKEKFHNDFVKKSRKMQYALSRYQDQSEELATGLNQKNRKLKIVQRKIASATNKIENLKQDNNQLGKQLEQIAKDRAILQKFSKKLSQAFTKIGVDIKIDDQNGEIEIPFKKNTFFKIGSSKLTKAMKRSLAKFMPVFSRQLFQSKKMRSIISSVEIIGFASPTYKGKYVQYNHLTKRMKKAINFNMKLSVKRAQSIFKYIYNPKKIKFSYQNEMLRFSKISGRSYLDSKLNNSGVLQKMSTKKYCKKYNCYSQQRAIIKINLKK